jgi:hypothetical protein
VEKRYYSAESLERVLLDLERRFGMSSEEFYAKVTAGERIEDMPGFERSVWASVYRDFCRMSGDDFASSVSRTLELA